MESQITDVREQETERSTIFWFDDGSIILHVEHLQFRVHRSILALHSSVFRDMLTIPQPNRQSESHDGTPIVHLLQDTVEEWVHLLSFIYFPAKVTNFERPDVSQLFALHRLGNKYEFDGIVLEVVRRMRIPFPQTLAQFISLQRSEDVQGFYDWFWGNVQNIMNLAEQAGIWSILPLVYYLTVASCKTNMEMNQIFWDPTFRFTPSQLRTLSRGRWALSRDIPIYPYCWAEHSKWGIFTEDCEDECPNYYFEIHEALRFENENVNIALDDMEKTISQDLLPCKKCYAEVKIDFDIGRELIWARLPEYFLGWSWKPVEDMDMTSKPAYWLSS